MRENLRSDVATCLQHTLKEELQRNTKIRQEFYKKTQELKTLKI